MSDDRPNVEITVRERHERTRRLEQIVQTLLETVVPCPRCGRRFTLADAARNRDVRTCPHCDRPHGYNINV